MRFDRLVGLKNSIMDRLRFAISAILVIMLLPALVSLLVLNSYGQRYHRTISSISRAAALRPMIRQDVPDALFMVVAGSVSPEHTPALTTLAHFQSELAALQQESPDQTELLVVARTLDTLNAYVGTLFDQVTREDPILSQEQTLDEVRAVANLISSMLDEFVTLRISQAEAASRQFQHDLRLLMMGGAAFLALALAFASVAQRALSRSVREPITQLEALAADLAGGNLQARAQKTHTEELIPLANSLNAMADKLEHLIEQNRQEQENLKRSELRTLQAQITPHFLYNTMDAIIWLAQTHRMDEVVQVSKAMSRFFRVSLSKGRDWITIEEEISHIEAYLTIQQIRYRDILRYRIQIEEELYPLAILKLVLQPLVENAIYHGVRNRRAGGEVVVTGELQGDLACFCVSDNGPGISAQRLQGVLDTINSPTPPTEGDGGFGLYNVNQRIKLYYGIKEGLRIQSDQQGTRVSFRVPARRQASDESVHR